ncbi:MAG: nucleotide sugar dehydrogenase [Clostridium lundense]|nr:nucleotide sugar dehydrogenase [Clostridium lundense]MBE6515647.1 nucleotide sugar dehydrogenase [Methanocorpusculum parvum]
MVHDYLLSKIISQTLTIGIVGQGYVGLPLAIEFSKKVRVIGFDVNQNTVESLNSGKSHIIDISDTILSEAIVRNRYIASSDPNSLRDCDVIIICVPTPLGKDKIPDLSYIRSAAETIAKILHENQYIVLESTTYPGTTEEVLIPILESGSGLKAGKDFFVAFSPERIDPGNKQFTVDNVPKVVGGMDSDVTDVICKVYSLAIPSVVPVSNTQTAEAVKMVENIFRHVNIALINELAIIFEQMGVDTWEVVSAAATKPYGFMPFYPGPGVGGHCIPLDPYYLSYRAKQYGCTSRFIEIAGSINEDMKIHVVNLAANALKSVGKTLYQSNIAVIGLAYKKDIDDLRESPAHGVIEELINRGAYIKVYDPYVEYIKTDDGVFTSQQSLKEALENADCAIFLVDHSLFMEIDIVSESKVMRQPIIVDTRNIFEKIDGITYIGLGKQNVEL